MTEGQSLLIATGVPLRKIAALCGVSQQTVSRWKDGVGRPEPARRARLEELYGIPFGSWDRSDRGPSPLPPTVRLVPVPDEETSRKRVAPVCQIPPAPPPPAKRLAVAHPGVGADALELIEYQLQDLIELGREIDSEGVLADRLKVREAQRKAVAELAKIRGELDKADESKLCKTARWIRLRTTIITTLADFPEALEAVIEALAKEEA